MKHHVLILAGMILLGASLTACNGEDDPTPEATATSTSDVAATETPTETATATEAGGATQQAPIGGFALPSLTVAVGTTVVWSNQDDVPHTATAEDGSFNSGNIQGGTFSHTFEEAGTYAYFCEVHPTMTGEITVS